MKEEKKTTRFPAHQSEPGGALMNDVVNKLSVSPQRMRVMCHGSIARFMAWFSSAIPYATNWKLEGPNKKKENKKKQKNATQKVASGGGGGEKKRRNGDPI